MPPTSNVGLQLCHFLRLGWVSLASVRSGIQVILPDCCVDPVTREQAPPTDTAREGEVLAVQRIRAHAEPLTSLCHRQQHFVRLLQLDGYVEPHLGLAPNLLKVAKKPWEVLRGQFSGSPQQLEFKRFPQISPKTVTDSFRTVCVKPAPTAACGQRVGLLAPRTRLFSQPPGLRAQLRTGAVEPGRSATNRSPTT